MELEQVLNTRRSHRVFLDDKINQDLIKELIIAATKAPVSCNLQITKYIVVNDKSVLKKLSDKVSGKFNYSPCIIVVIHDNRFSIGRSSGIFSTAMAVENMILKATELGLGTCALAGFNKDDKIKKILNIPNYFDIDLLLVVGYIDNKLKLPEIPKIEINQLFSFNNFDNLKTIKSSDNIMDHSIDSIIDYRRRIAPVYLERFRLNTFNNFYYHDVVNFFKDKILPKIKSKNILDLMSYDGKFLKIIHDENIDLKFSFYSSDYLSNNLAYINDQLGLNTYKINNKNQIEVEDESFDLITSIFQLEFTPKLNSLICSAQNKLKPGGYLFVVVIKESLIKQFIKGLIKFYKKTFKGEVYNIYENNAFYKIGPIKQLSVGSILSIFNNNGLKLIKKGLISKYQNRGTKINYYLFKK